VKNNRGEGSMKYKRIILLLCVFFSVSLLHAQGKFDFNRIKAESHSFMTKEAGLTVQEAARFFPVYDEMREKQRGYFERLRAIHNSKPSSEREASKMIEQADAYEIQLKQIEQRYHKEMLKVIPEITPHPPKNTQSLPPHPPLLQRGGVLETVCLGVMKGLILINLLGK